MRTAPRSRLAVGRVPVFIRTRPSARTLSGTLRWIAPTLLLASAAPAQTLEDLRFMSGCWEGSFEAPGGGGTIEEHYTTPSDNVMLGTTRYLAGSRTVMFELHRIEADSAGVHLTPYPRGRPSEHAFRLTRAGGAAATFEAPEHDFPKRILYRLDPHGTLVARVDGGEGTEGEEWQLRRAACP